MKCILTQYYLSCQGEFNTNNCIPVKDYLGNVLAVVDPYFFSSMSLEGSGKLANGKVLNVSGYYFPIDGLSRQELIDVADKEYRGVYHDVGLSDDCSKYLCFSVSPTIWGVGIKGSPLLPFVSVATDQSVYPFGTVLSCPALKGIAMPDGSTHSGYLYCQDTGGNIKGQHIDFFSGIKEWGQWINKLLGWSIDVSVYG